MHTGTFKRETLWTEAVKLCGVKQHAASRRKPRFSLLEMEMLIVPKGMQETTWGVSTFFFPLLMHQILLQPQASKTLSEE